MNKIIKSLLIPTTLATAVVPFVAAVSCAKENPFDQHSITLSSASENMVPGQTLQLKAYVNPPTLSQEVTWSSSDDSIASVNPNGLVTALKNGAAIILAKSVIDPTISTSCTITITTPIIEDYSVTVDKDETTQTFMNGQTAVYYSLNATGKDFQEGDDLSIEICYQETVEGVDYPKQHKISLTSETWPVKLNEPIIISIKPNEILENFYCENVFALRITPKRGSKDLSFPITINNLHFIYGCESSPIMFSYSESSLGGLKITGFNSTLPAWKYCSKLVIPTVYRDSPVVEIADGAFENNFPPFINTVVINSTKASEPNYLKRIGKRSFYNGTQIESDISIPPTVEEIDDEAFYHCKNVSAINLLQNDDKTSALIRVGKFAFYNCSAARGSLIIPKTVSQIGNYAFTNLRSIDTFEFEVDENNECALTKIEDYAFKYLCASNELKIPASITTIGKGSFEGCYRFTSLEFLKNSDNTTKLNDIQIDAFNDCFNISNVLTIPSTVKNIDKQAFAGCNELSGVVFENSSEPPAITTIGESAFSGCKNLSGEIRIPKTITNLGNYAFYGCSSLSHIVFETDENNECGLTRIGRNTFAACLNLTGPILIPASITEIEQFAFVTCSSLDYVEFLVNKQNKSSLQTIGMNAFFLSGMSDTSGPDGTYSFKYDGSVADWKAITRTKPWHSTESTMVQCSDGPCGLDEK